MVMLRGIVENLEKHHKVRILDEAVSAAVKLSHRYLTGRQLPDKAVSVLDTACARLSLGQSATPAAIEEMTRLVENLTVQRRVLEREAAAGADHSEILEQTASKKADAEAKLAEASRNYGRRPAGWSKRSGSCARNWSRRPAGRRQVAHGNGRLTLELDTLQGDTPIMRVCVDQQIVGEVISGWTGIPVGKMVKDELAMVLDLETHLGKRVIGQDHALEHIGQRIATSRASLDDPQRPVGVFMLVGPSGVGKTETALALADLLYGGEGNLITINMSEFQEAHTVSTLKGSPPGYVGYGEGGVLTEAVRRRPYSVVLLDEVEKAHPDVLELFYQVFDKGVMEDGEGRRSISRTRSSSHHQRLYRSTGEAVRRSGDHARAGRAGSAIKPELEQVFQPAFLGPYGDHSVLSRARRNAEEDRVPEAR